MLAVISVPLGWEVCLLLLCCDPPFNLELPFAAVHGLLMAASIVCEGVSAASCGSKVKHPKCEKAPGAAGVPPNYLISVRQQSFLPIYTVGFIAVSEHWFHAPFGWPAP